MGNNSRTSTKDTIWVHRPMKTTKTAKYFSSGITRRLPSSTDGTWNFTSTTSNRSDGGKAEPRRDSSINDNDDDDDEVITKTPIIIIKISRAVANISTKQQ